MKAKPSHPGMSTLSRVLWCVATVLALVGVAAEADTPTQSLTSSVVQAGGLALTNAGKALLPVVISPQASEQTKEVAKELVKYLSQITGAQFEVRDGDGTSGIVLGTLAEFPHPQLTKPLEIRNHYNGREAFAIRTETNRVLLIGATDLGASHAAYRFLESLGTRWLFPAPEWEVVPSIPSLQVKLNKDSRPVILSRRIWYGYGFFDRPSRFAYNDWARRNRMAASLHASAGHTWDSIVRHHKELFDAHPEYFALVKQKDGTLKRQPPMLDPGNAEVRKFVSNWAVEYFRKNPDAEMVSIGPADGLYKNESPESKAYGATVSDQIYGYVNEVARAVQKEFPGKMVGILAYSNYADPPSFPLEPNVYIQLTRGFNYGKLSFDELLEEWPKRAKTWGMYEYYSVHISDYDMLPGGGGANVAAIRTRIPQYAAMGVTAFSAESSNNWGPNGRGYYLANRLMWNPQADVEAILADFYEKAFGPGAAAMQRYYERFNPSQPGSTRPIVTEHLIGMAFRDVEAASRLAKNHSEVLARLEHVKQYLHYAHMYWDLRRERDKVKRRDLQLEIFKHGYRTRYSYMLHWMPMQRHWSNRAAKEHDEPSWALGAPEPRPWVGTPEYTSVETEQHFQEGLKYFQVKTGMEEKSYSHDLVPVRFPGETPPSTTQTYRQNHQYVFYSVRGEPLTMTITPGWLRTESGLREETYFTYRVTDANGAPVVEDKFDTDGKPHALSIKVPRAGRYHVSFSDAGLGWSIETAGTQPAALVLPLDRGVNPKQRVPMYFYVPKGTRQISYAFDGASHTVNNPDGKPVQRVYTGEMATIPVAPGFDGKVWSFQPYLAGEIQFSNLPGYVSPSPTLILLPRELAKKDGLEIVAK